MLLTVLVSIGYCLLKAGLVPKIRVTGSMTAIADCCISDRTDFVLTPTKPSNVEDSFVFSAKFQSTRFHLSH